jgi:hypothetical protein
MGPRGSLSVRALALGALVVPAAATADHAGALRAEPLSPLVAAVLAAALTLVGGLLVLAVIMRRTRRAPPRGDRTGPT